MAMNLGRDRFFLIGGRLCIDFANTVRAPGHPAGHLGSWEALIDFLWAAGAVDRGAARRLERLAQTDRTGCACALGQALALREMIRRLLAALEAGRSAAAATVGYLNEILRAPAGHDRLVRERGHWQVRFVPDYGHSLAAVVLIARSAAEVIADGPSVPIRQCAHPECVLYFYDDSKAGRRRWCSMAACGNRMKVAAYARRARKERGRRAASLTRQQEIGQR